ncbi:MAG: hypothetical protein WCF67_15490 [Chitinophagaceae bacterium]
MKNILSFASFAMIVLLTACSGGSGGIRKVIVMANGKMQVDPNTHKITLDPSNTHTEQEIMLESSNGKASFEVETTGKGKQNFDVNEDGVYLLNLKVDTLVGGIVNYSETGRAASISGEQLERMVDSTRQLIEGKNVSDAKKTYFIIPWNIKRITADANARIIGPYNLIPRAVDVDDKGKAAEIYKFYTNKQKREELSEFMNRFK